MGISQNINLTWEIIDSIHSDTWDILGLCTNSFTREKCLFFQMKERNYFRNWYKKTPFVEEYIKKRFHPKHIDKFIEWGF